MVFVMKQIVKNSSKALYRFFWNSRHALFSECEVHVPAKLYLWLGRSLKAVLHQWSRSLRVSRTLWTIYFLFKTNAVSIPTFRTLCMAGRKSDGEMAYPTAIPTCWWSTFVGIYVGHLGTEAKGRLWDKFVLSLWKLPWIDLLRFLSLASHCSTVFAESAL